MRHHAGAACGTLNSIAQHVSRHAAGCQPLTWPINADIDDTRHARLVLCHSCELVPRVLFYVLRSPAIAARFNFACSTAAGPIGMWPLAILSFGRLLSHTC